VGQLRVCWPLAVALLVAAFWGSGCSSSTMAVTLSPSTAQTVSAGQTLTITAAVANDKNSQGVTWSLSGPGALSGNTKTTVVYTAPSEIPIFATASITATSVANSGITATLSITLNAVFSITTATLPAGTLNVPYDAFVNASGETGTFTWNIISGSLPAGLTLQPSTTTTVVISGTPTALGTSDFTIQVTDSQDSNITQALSITINRPPALAITTASLQAGTVGTLYSQSLQATGGTLPYTWSLIGGTLPIGLNLSADGVIAGTPVASGTSPFTVQVTDSSSPSKQVATANLSITVSPGSTNNLKLSGNYAFSVRGFDPSGLFVAAGSFVADGNGGISGGIMDLNDPAAVQLSQGFSGTYSISTSGLGIMTFNLNSGGSRTFALALTASGNASMIEFDDINGTGTRNSGVLLKQDTSAFTTASITGGYAFGFLGIDPLSNRYGVAGEFQAGGGNITGGALDSDDSSSGPSSNVAITGGTYSVASTGRGTLTIDTGAGSTDYSFYVVNASQLLVMDIDAFGANPLVAGAALQQTTPGSFSNSSLDGAGVFETTALEAPSTSQAQVGVFTTAGSGTSTLSSDVNTGGTLSSGSSNNGTYSVSASGRVTLTNSGFQTTSDPVMYLVSPNQAFIVGTDAAATFGLMDQQSLSGVSLSGTYAGGSLAPVDPAVSNVVSIGVVGSDIIDFTTDVSNTTGLSQTQFSLTIASDTNGRVVLTENGSTAAILYLVLPSEFFSLSTDTNARVDVFQQ
jgi:hypothetical protein